MAKKTVFDGAILDITKILLEEYISDTAVIAGTSTRLEDTFFREVKKIKKLNEVPEGGDH